VELIIELDRWTLSVADRDLVMRKNAANRLDVALLLKFLQSAGPVSHIDGRHPNISAPWKSGPTSNPRPLLRAYLM
jgi:hypothetical protein